MSKIISLMITLVVSLFAINALAFTPPPAPEKGWYVTDMANKLTPDQKQRLNQKIEQVNKATANEFGVLILQTMDGDNIEDAAYTTFRKWGVGKKDLDNGCLIIISVAERKSRIETGKGVGGDVPDITAKEILANNLAPFLKKGDFYGGLVSTLDALDSRIESRRAERDAQLKAQNSKRSAPTVPDSPTVYTNTQPSSGGCDAGGVGAGGFSLMVLLVLGAGIILLVRSAQKREEERRRAALEAEEEAEQIRREIRAQAAAARKREEEDRLARQRQLERERELELQKREATERERIRNLPTPAVTVPVVPPTRSIPRPATKTIKSEPPKKHASSDAAALAAAAAASAASAARLRQQQQEDAERYRRQQEEAARAQRERDEADRRRREREEEDRRSSYSSYSSSSSSFDWGGSSGGSDSGSGFGGGDSGGGGASGDW